MKISVSSFCSNLDLFGKRPQLYISGNTKYSTKVGIFLTIVLFLFCLVCLGYFGKDVIYKSAPEVIYKESYNHNPEVFLLDQSKIPLMVGLNDENGRKYFTDNRFLNVTITELILSRGNSPVIRSFLMEICSEDHFKDVSEQAKEYFMKFNLSNYFCIGKNIRDLKLQGAFDQELFSSVIITVNRCENYTNSAVICASLEEIQQEMSYGFIGLYFNDFNIDSSEVSEYKSFSPREVFSNFVLKSAKSIDILLKNNRIVTEDGLVFESSVEEHLTNYESFREFNFITEKTDFFKINLKLSQKMAYHMRKYKKIQDVLANVGGIFNIFWLFALVVQMLYINILYVVEIINDIFILSVRRHSIIKRNTQKSLSSSRGGLNSSKATVINALPSPLIGIFPRRSHMTVKQTNFLNERPSIMEKLDFFPNMKNENNIDKALFNFTNTERGSDPFRRASHSLKDRASEKPTTTNSRPSVFRPHAVNSSKYLSPERESFHKRAGPNIVITEVKEERRSSATFDMTRSENHTPELSSDRKRLIIEQVEGKTQVDGTILDIELDSMGEDINSSRKASAKHAPSTPKSSLSSLEECSDEDGDHVPSRKMKEKQLSSMKSQLQTAKENQEKMLQEGKIEHFRIGFGFLDFINYYTGLFNTPERNQKKLIIKKGIAVLKDKLGIHQLIEKLYEIDKLKFILLDEYQSDVFSLLPKPQLELIEEEEIEELINLPIMKESQSKRKTSFHKETEPVSPTVKRLGTIKPKVSATLFDRRYSHFERIKKDSHVIGVEVLSKFKRRNDKKFSNLDKKLIAMMHTDSPEKKE